MGTVGATEGVAGMIDQFGVNGQQIAFRQDDIAVENDHIFTCRTLHTIVAALSGTAVLFHEILQIESVGIFVADILAWLVAAVFDDNNLKILECLTGETVEQFVYFVGTVENGDDKRVFHDFSCLWILSFPDGSVGCAVRVESERGGTRYVVPELPPRMIELSAGWSARCITEHDQRSFRHVYQQRSSRPR